MKEYDVVIVGAGPGGSTAAKVAAEKGLKTIFFERGRKPGEKNSSGCGLGPGCRIRGRQRPDGTSSEIAILRRRNQAFGPPVGLSWSDQRGHSA